MKLLPVIVAVAKAQNINLPDLSNFDLSAFGLGPGGLGNLDLNFPAAGDEERYFFTTLTITTPAPPTTTLPPVIAPGGSCWKCDQMSYAMCATMGSFEHCHDGDEDCCFVEIREKDQELAQLCTGCKDETACMDMKGDNFVGNSMLNYQCRSDYRLQRAGRSRGQQSVCRQCFKTCDQTGDISLCFGSIDSTAVTPNVMFTLDSDETIHDWNGFYNGADVLGFGIPTHGKLSDDTDSALITEIETFVATSLNIYFKNVADGKVHVDDGALRSADDQTYWSLQGASKAWWMSDIKDIQTTLSARTAAIATAIVLADFQ